MAFLGAVTAAAGAAIIIIAASAAGSRRSGGAGESLLAPTLAVDTLDADLRVAYMRTLVLDARTHARFGPGGGEHRALGREIRRAIVGLQAARHQGGPGDADQVEDLIDQAIDHVERGDPPAGGWEVLTEVARELRASLTPSDLHPGSFE